MLSLFAVVASDPMVTARNAAVCASVTALLPRLQLALVRHHSPCVVIPADRAAAWYPSNERRTLLEASLILAAAAALDAATAWRGYDLVDIENNAGYMPHYLQARRWTPLRVSPLSSCVFRQVLLAWAASGPGRNAHL